MRVDVRTSHHIDWADCAQRTERDSVGTCLAADEAFTGCRNLMSPTRTCFHRSVVCHPHSGVPFSRKERTAANWSLGFKTTDHIRRGGPRHETATSDC